MPCVGLMTTNPMQCGALTRDGDPCKSMPVAGSQRCRMHGGTNPGRPIETGRYSVVHRAALAEKVQRFLDDPAPGDLTAELAMMRALFQEYLDRYPDGVRLPVEEIERMYSMIGAVSHLVERIARILNQSALTVAEVQLLQVTIAHLVMEYVDGSDRQIAFLDALAATLSGGGRGPGVRLTTDASA